MTIVSVSLSPESTTVPAAVPAVAKALPVPAIGFIVSVFNSPDIAAAIPVASRLPGFKANLLVTDEAAALALAITAASFALSAAFNKLGAAINAKTPKITTTIKSSKRVKPCFFFIMLNVLSYN